MVSVPAVTPATVPVDEPTVATAGLLLLHEPPPVLLNKVEVDPTHVLVVPVIAGGFGLTETDAVAIQPVGSV